MGQYRAGDGKAHEIAKNVRKEINYFAKGSANAYTGFYGNQITCTGGTLHIDGVEVLLDIFPENTKADQF